MRSFVSTVLGVLSTLVLSLPVAAATEAPTSAQDALPIGLVLVVIAGVLTFAYVFTRPSRITGRKD